MEDEAYLQKGFKLTFDKDFNLQSTPISSMAEKCMRPTFL